MRRLDRSTKALASLLLVLSVPLPLSAADVTASTTTELNVRTGPGIHFEVQAVLPARASVRVLHCDEGWQWCEVDMRRLRGWVNSKYLDPSVEGRVPVVSDPTGRQRSRPGPATTPEPAG
jgi:uncharacterized protein YraI